MRRDHPLSTQLRAFVKEYPYERRSILQFLQQASRELPVGSRVLDAGAGDAPYRELFGHCRYVTADFAATEHHDFGRNKPDITCDLRAIPVSAGYFDAVVCTQVLEHVPDPATVLVEFFRILGPNGQLFITVPLVGEVHEQPYDFYRYTSYSLDRLFHNAGFRIESIYPRGGSFLTAAELVHRSYLWLPPMHFRGAYIVRVLIDSALRRLIAPFIARLDRHDQVRVLTLGYACHCRIPT